MAAESYLVIGGEGFLGHHLVTALTRSYPNSSVTSLDLVQRHFATPSAPLRHSFVSADLTSVDSLVSAFRRSDATTVFHTASPWVGSSKAVCEKVNVQGTRGVVEACKRTAVQKLVYTSSASVVFRGKDVIGVDERLPLAPEKHAWDAYNISKAKAETIALEANGKDGLLTIALRPAGIFGPGDRQAVPGFIQVLKEGKNRFQVGDNTNLFDWTYVDNIVHAHLLAAERLSSSVPITSFAYRKPPVALTVPRRRIPTSETLDAEDLQNGSASTQDGEKLPPLRDVTLPARRNRFDQFSAFNLDALIDPSAAVAVEDDDDDDEPTIPVAGKAYFVTNGEPVFFWDFARAIWTAYLGHAPPKPWVIPQFLILLILPLVALVSFITRRPATFTRAKVILASVNRWHNIERARIMLGYEPLVGVEEGVRRSVEWYKADEAAQAAAKAQ